MYNIDGSLENYIRLVKHEIVELDQEFSPVYEAASIIKKYDGVSPVLFKVKGYTWRFISNIFPRRDYLISILGSGSEEVAYERITTPIEGEFNYRSFNDYFRQIEPRIENIPALKFYKDDGGLYVTSSIFIACLSDKCNASIHRMMVNKNKKYIAVRVVPRHLYKLMSEARGGIPVAVIIGVDPVIELFSSLSPPFGVFELKLAAGFLGGLNICKTPVYNLPVPCGSSMIIEGVLGPERAREGPFTDLLDLYDAEREEPVLKIDSIYVNKRYEPLIHVILPGGTEHKLLMGFPREAQIYRSVKSVIPTIRKVRLTLSSGMWLHAIISIEKQHDGDGKTAALAALSAHPSLKHVVVVDSDIDPDNIGEVEWAIATRFQADRGLVVIPYARGSTLDPSSKEGLTWKIVVDATMPIKDRYKYRKPTMG